MVPPTAESAVPAATHRKIVERRRGDHSQRIRRAVQLAFLALNVWIGVEFYGFVRYYETGGATPWFQRPPGVEGWLPIASLMNLKYAVETGRLPQAHAAGLFLLLSFLFSSILFRKAFCGWLCPVGTLSELLWKSGRALFRRNFALPAWADLPLRSLKYILMGLFLYAVGGMSAMAIRLFLDGPYGVVADVKMLNFFRYLGTAGAITIATLVILSVLVKNFWCRYLCPYGALMGLVARFSPVRIRRDAALCIDCAKCAKVCPSVLPVDRLVQVRSPECIACYECVAACPAQGALEMTATRTRRLPAWAFALGVAIIFLGFSGSARYTGYWHTNVPSQIYFDLIPHANEFTHP